MNSVSEALIPKVYAIERSNNAITQAAMIAAGVVSGDLSDPAVQAALGDVMRDAPSSENPAMWVAAFLADIAINGLPGAAGGGGGGTGDMDTAVYDPDENGVINVAQGGTGASTAAAARTSLGINVASTLVTGSDGAEYERVVFSDGTVRFVPVYETLP